MRRPFRHLPAALLLTALTLDLEGHCTPGVLGRGKDISGDIVGFLVTIVR